MKRYLSLCMLACMLLAATGASAQWRKYTDDRFAPRYTHDGRYYYRDRQPDVDDNKTNREDKEYKQYREDVHYYDCPDAWRKRMKSEKKAWKANERYYEYRDEAAERKMYKAEKKAWKSHRIEHSHSYEYRDYRRPYRDYRYYNDYRD